jgi:D-alanyl-D-alanine carboxypeptidase/D-alanyl-D-alanine-endopeptidase (penicillin-binding protein 4)
MSRAARDGSALPALGRSAVAAGLACALALGGCGIGASRGPSTASHGRSLSALASARSSAGRPPAARRLRARLGRDLAGEGSGVGALVVELGSGRTLYAVKAGVMRAPASVEKLYTSVAALQLLGPTARLRTDIYGVGHLGRGGVWHGNLYLRGGGDPTFGDGTFNRLDEDGQGPTSTQLVAQLVRDGIRRVTGLVYPDASIFDSLPGGPLTGYRPDLPDYGGELSALVFDHGAIGDGRGPAAFAAHEVVLTMNAQGIRARASRATRVTPPGARLLASVASPPMTELLKLMDVPSDDLFADLLTKQIGHRFFGSGTLAKGAIEIARDIAARFGLRPVIHDGSGLDPADRSSPLQVVTLLGRLWGTGTGAELVAALPVVGEEGTVQSIGVGTPARGRCVAKTGTLTDVTNLAGYCTTRRGRTLAFAIFIDGPPNWQAIEHLSEAVGDIAGY